MNNRSVTKKITYPAMIAVIYFVLTTVFAPISFQQVQFRISEMLTVLPIFTYSAVPGLTIGCIIANIYGVYYDQISAIDIVFGSFGTAIAAIATYYIGKKSSSKTFKYIFGPFPAVIVNAIIIGAELTFIPFKDMLRLPLYLNMLYVGLGELVVCYLLGVPLMAALYKNQFYKKIFR